MNEKVVDEIVKWMYDNYIDDHVIIEVCDHLIGENGWVSDYMIVEGGKIRELN